MHAASYRLMSGAEAVLLVELFGELFGGGCLRV